MGLFDKAKDMAKKTLSEAAYSVGDSMADSPRGKHEAAKPSKKVWKEPWLLIDAIKAFPTVSVGAVDYFPQSRVKKLDPFKKMQFKMLKPTKKLVPDDWDIDPGTLVVVSPDGDAIGLMDAGKVEAYGFKSSKLYYGYVMPPVKDYYEGIEIEDHYSVEIFTDRMP